MESHKVVTIILFSADSGSLASGSHCAALKERSLTILHGQLFAIEILGIEDGNS